MIPLEDFFRKPDKAMLRLSPGGGYLAYLEPYERRLNITVMDVQSGETRRVTEATERDIGGFVWVSEDRLVYVRDSGGDENYRLYAVGRDGSNPLDLTPFDGVKCDLIDELEDEEDEILFQMNKRVPEIFDAYRMNVHTGEMRIVAENPGNIQTWITDHEGRVRLATTTDGVNTSILFRSTEDEPLAARRDLRFQGERAAASLHLRQRIALRVEQHRPRPGGDLRVRRQERDAGARRLRASRGGRLEAALLEEA